MDCFAPLTNAAPYLLLLYSAWASLSFSWRPIMYFSPMILHHAVASEYLAAMIWRDSTHHPVCIHRQLMYRRDGLAGHFQLAGIFNQSNLTANLLCYYFGLLAPNLVGTLQIALDLAGQNTVPTLFANCQRVLCQMLKTLACNAVLCHGPCTATLTMGNTGYWYALRL